MHSYLQILVRVENDGSLHALGAFSSKEKQKAYQEAAGLKDNQIRLDFYNGPFDDSIKVIYAGHRRWNMDRFQLGGYFRNESDAWNSVTQEGYVSVLRVDTSYAEEQALEREALELYAKLQKKWRLSSYEELIAREGIQKARANIMLRFYEDTLESFKPQTRRDIRALYALFAVMLVLPFAILFFLRSAPDFGENIARVEWLPESATDISFYRSKQVEVYEFNMDTDAFRDWAEARGMAVRQLINQEIVSRYKAYVPPPSSSEESSGSSREIDFEALKAWQQAISVKIEVGLIAKGEDDSIAVYDFYKQRAYFEHLINF
ncbi:MAG: hypothetical protein HRT56_08510 [Coraliomargarita sp.]|nr:hypothetical protein [Coraliomargarita sp.]